MASVPSVVKIFELNSVDHPLPLQFRVLKVEKQCELEICDVEIPEHLGNMRIGECGYDFGIDEHQAVDDHVGNESSDQLPPIMDIELFLLFNNVPQRSKLNGECPFLKFFIKSRPKVVQDAHCSANDGLAEFFMDQF